MKNKWFEFVYLPHQKFLISLVLICLVVSSVLGFFLPRYISNVFSSYTEGNFEQSLWFLFFLFLGEYLNRLVYQISINRYVQKLILKVRGAVYQRWLLSYESHMDTKGSKDRYPLGEILARVMSDTEAVRELVTTGSFGIFIDVTFIVACLVGFVQLNTTSGVFLLSIEVLACVLLVWGSRYMVSVFMSVRKSVGMMSRTLADLTGGLRDYYYTPHGPYLMNRGERSFQDFLTKQLRANVWDASYFSLAESLYPIILACLMFIFPYTNIVEMAVLAAIIDLIQRSIAPIKDVTSKISNIQRAKTGLQRITEFYSDLEKSPSSSLEQKEETIDLSRLSLNIDSFSYGTNFFTLKNIAIEARRGELVGIVGFSGSGKSTLLKILSVQIISSQSRIQIEDQAGKHHIFMGNSLEQINRYREQVSIVSQDSHVFSASLKMNIGLGQKEEQFDEFWHKVREQIPYLKKWGPGPRDIIDPKELSLGQKQLLSALRACFLQKPIVLFDEVSSGMDSDLEDSIRRLVLKVQQHSLTFIVAHRVETIIKANKILVMDDGQVVAEGKHEQLLATSDIYSQFIQKISS